MTATGTISVEPTTRAALLDAVAAIRPTLDASAAESERLGTLAPAAVDALHAAGIFRVQRPTELGGIEVDPITEMEVFEAVTAADTASGWCAFIGSGNAAMLGAYLPDGGVTRVFDNGDQLCGAGSFFPAGVAVAENGGYRLSGRWRFCSGVRHSGWLWLGAVIRRGEGGSGAAPGAPETRFVTIPVSDATIHDNWQVTGLSGTGSCDISVSDVYVPEEMTFQWDSHAPNPRRGDPLFSLAVQGLFAKYHIAFALGVARRALEELVRLVTETKGAWRSSPLLERQVVHRLVGELDLKLSGARELAHARYRAVWTRLQAGEAIDMATQVELQAISNHVTDLAVEIAGAAFRYGGAGALFTPNILERLLRDIQAAGQHIFVGDVNYETHGKHLLGLAAT